MGVQSSDLQNTKISSILLLLWQTGFVWENPLFFVLKKCGNFTCYVLRAVWCLPKGLGRRLAQYFSGFVHQMKVYQQIGRKVSILAAC
jgi:hypothetical protein